MIANLKPSQHLLLWHLAVDNGGGFLTNINKIGKPPERNALIKAGLVLEEKRINPEGKSKQKVKYFALTENGWSWCQDNMTWPKNATSTQAGKVLALLLPRLRRVFETREPISSLGEFINKSAPLAPAKAPIVNADANAVQAIRDACRTLANGKEGVRLRIADVRKQISGFCKDDITLAFWDLCAKGEISLYHMDDPREIQPDDRDAAVTTSTGEEKHIVYFGGKAS